MSYSPVGVELGYADVTSNPSGITQVGFANRVDVTGLTITVAVGARPIKLIAFFNSALNNTANDGGAIGIFEGSTQVAQSSFSGLAANAFIPLVTHRRFSPTAGSHTYKVQAWASTGGTLTLGASSVAPGFLQAIEC